MQTERFKIYTRRDGFYNSEFLNSIGLEIFDIFKELKKYSNRYFHRVNSITITSQERKDNINSAHYTNQAIDFIIDPIEYIPYYFGVLHAIKPYNIYLGFDKDLHIHIDDLYSKYANRKGIETRAGVQAITGFNIDAVLNKYGFSWLEKIQDFGLFNSNTRKLLLTYYKSTDKLPLSYFCNFPELPDADNGFLLLAAGAAVLYFLTKRSK